MEEGGADTGEAPTTDELERDFDAALKTGSAPAIAETGLRLAASYSSNDALAQALDALRLALKRGDYSDHLDPEAEICAELGSILHYRMHDSLAAETWYRRPSDSSKAPTTTSAAPTCTTTWATLFGP